jgi:Tfp pilus assembly protein FimT
MNISLHRRAAAAPGFTLLEVLVYLAVLVVVVGCATMTCFECLHSATSIRQSADDVARALDLGERWRSDIRGATGPVQVTGAGAAEECRVPMQAGEVVYTFANGEIRRQAGPSAPNELWLANVKSSQIQSETRGHVLAWRWELELKSKRRDVKLRPLFTFESCVSGNEGHS